MSYNLVYRNNIYNYLKCIGTGTDKSKCVIQSKNFILDYLRTNKINLEYTNTIDFELNLLQILQEENKVIYKTDTKYESFSFYFINHLDKKIIDDNLFLNEKLIYSKLIFEEDIELAKKILYLKEYNFDKDIIEHKKLKLKYNTKLILKKKRSNSI